MSQRPVLAAFLSLAITGCATGEVSPSAILLQTASPSSTPSAIPATPIPSPPASTPTTQPTSTGAVKVCEQPDAGYAVSYPANWHVGAEADGFDGCSVFGPSPFSNPDDPAIDITLTAEPDMGWNNPFGSLGEFEGYELLLDEEERLFGHRVRHVVWEITKGGSGMAVGDLQTRFAMEYRPGWFMTAQALSAPEIHEETTAVLMEMLESLEMLPLHQ